jgi:hypothetical protein
MQNVLKILGIIVGVIVLGIIIFLGSLGAFSKITVTEQEVGPYTYVYKSFVGDYKLTETVFDDVYAQLKKNNIPAGLGIGIYYDNPQTVAADKLRSDCGSIIADTDAAKAKKLGKDFTVKTLPKAKRVVAEFPIKNTLSYILGPIKAYPALMAYAKDKGYSEMVVGIEIYDMAHKKTLYVMDIVKK